ncbi:class I SAM-dependent methyltransferase [Pseudodesulfovibrio sp.]|uniref:class I SAM-dependent methyltransferase n=1 Tax=Pseudodesulfovibrio sp. TaxID=2035812 RepID=UPI00260D3C00|nr:class I SAM-dependent methyltransferase [Pseudodesulfovibrio sp.]MDD3311791.1 class I SAM-dependent methyltransferase [Pseudodesulfovibrio sp.]
MSTASDERPCPVCGSREYEPYLPERIDPKAISEQTYASRKNPEFMRHRLVHCPACDVVYTPRPPASGYLEEQYAQAAYGSGEEARCAAQTYARILGPYLGGMPDFGLAVEVGAGNGAFLRHLRDAGFAQVTGIEPSDSAINAAASDVRPMLRRGVFSAEWLQGRAPALVCSFMTLEHLPSPREFVGAASAALAPGGRIALVVHDRRAWLNRALGQRSPIIDIEHLQLFSRRSVQALLEGAGFVDVSIKAFSNSYPPSYWLRLTPLPVCLKNAAGRLIKRMGLEKIRVTLPVGNIFVTGRKIGREVEHETEDQRERQPVQ